MVKTPHRSLPLYFSIALAMGAPLASLHSDIPRPRNEREVKTGRIDFGTGIIPESELRRSAGFEPARRDERRLQVTDAKGTCPNNIINIF